MTIKVTYNVTDVYMSQSVSPVYINVSYSDGSSSGGGVWGTITGTLSNQTDLQNALNAKVPYSGATGDVSLGEYGINVGNVIYDTTPTGIPTEQGATYWDADAETVALIMNGTIQKIGEDTFYHVRNTTGSTIAKGTAVRFSGTTGNSGRLLIAPMLADGTYPSQYYMGITSEELVNNADGKVYHFGKMRNINTSAFADGDVLYVSSSVAGALTATAPVAPNNIIVAAAVVHAANNGTLMIRTTLGSNINADEGVLLTTPTANQGLFYDSGLWVNKSITTALGYTPANAATTLTINGVTYDLSTSRTWTIAAGISGSGAAGQVTYWTGASAVSGSNNLFWDATNNRLGIGTNAPIEDIDIIKSKGSSASVTISTKNTNSGGEAAFVARNDQNEAGTIEVYGSAFSVVNLRRQTAFNATTLNGSTFLLYNDAATANFSIKTGFTTITERFRLWNNTGNLLLQSGGTFSDLGYRLGVVGDTLLRGSGATSATTALTVQNSSSTNLFVVRNDGNVGIGTNAPAFALSVATNANAAAGVTITNSSTGNNQRSVLRVINNTGENGTFSVWGSATGLPNKTLFESSKDFIIGTDSNTATGGTSKFQIYVGGYNAVTSPQLSFHATANLSIGSTSDNGQRLQVYGDTLLRGSGATDATTALTVQNSSSTNILRIRNNGEYLFGNSGSFVWAWTYSSNYNTADLNGTNFALYPINGSINLGGGTQLQTSGNQNNVITKGRFQPTSGTATFTDIRCEPLINQTGGANGITRGLYVNPTLTSAADFRAIEVSAGITVLAPSVTARASLRIPSGTAPTSPNDGDIWFDGTDIKMRIGGVTKTFTLI